MEIILLVMMLCGALVFAYIAAKICSFIGTSLIKAQPPEGLSHQSILTLLTKLEHPEFDGVCYGFTLNWAKAAAKGPHKEALFYQKIALLRQHQTDLPTVLKRLEEKQQRNEPLSSEEQLITKLPKLCWRICVAQDPLEYKTIYGKLFWQPDINPILHTISKASLKQIFYKTHTFASRQEAESYFNTLITVKLPSNVPVVISTADHAMGFKRTGVLWRFININDLYEQQKQRPYFEFTSQQLVQELYRVSTLSPLSKRLTVNTDFIALKPYQPLSQTLQNIFPVFPIGPKTTAADKLSFMAMAALQGDLPTVKKCLQASWSIFSRHQMSNDSPIFTAIVLGRRDVVKAMLCSVPHRINQHRAKDRSTVLHLACQHGGSGMVEDLLQIKGIIIDSKDCNGRTPLMCACESTVITEDAHLFELLLKRGASLTVKDNDGLTALDHARKNEHTLAISLFEKCLAKKRIYPGPKTGFFRKKAQEDSRPAYDLSFG